MNLYWINSFCLLGSVCSVGFAALLGAILAYYTLPFVWWTVPYLLSLSAASFLYIALADLVPGRRNWGGLRGLVQEMALIGAGLGTIAELRIDTVK